MMTPSPRLNNVRNRGECCQHCARYGLDPGAAARLYILSHAELGAVKIGITGLRTREDRVVQIQRRGWVPFARLPFAMGVNTYRVEQSVTRRLRAEGHGVFFNDARMPIGGYKETFDATSVSGERLLALAEAEW